MQKENLSSCPSAPNQARQSRRALVIAQTSALVVRRDAARAGPRVAEASPSSPRPAAGHSGTNPLLALLPTRFELKGGDLSRIGGANGGPHGKRKKNQQNRLNSSTTGQQQHFPSS